MKKNQDNKEAWKEKGGESEKKSSEKVHIEIIIPSSERSKVTFREITKNNDNNHNKKSKDKRRTPLKKKRDIKFNKKRQEKQGKSKKTILKKKKIK